MSAFNWIEFEWPCPHCGEEQCIRAQTYMVSDYNGDERGRFHDLIYSVGDDMRWWDTTHPDYEKWKNGNKKDTAENENNEDYECCYARCLSCDGELSAIIRFVDRVPVEVKEIGLPEAWPDSYLK